MGMVNLFVKHLVGRAGRDDVKTRTGQTAASKGLWETRCAGRAGRVGRARARSAGRREGRPCALCARRPELASRRAVIINPMLLNYHNFMCMCM